MSELTDLYQEVILDHNKSPRNFGLLENANRVEEGFNPLCGDHLHVYMVLRDDVIQDIRFEGMGCAISKASASIMTTLVKGKSKQEAESIFEQFRQLVTAGLDDLPDPDSLGRLAVFAGVREFPSRIKCASLPWHTLHAAMTGQDTVVSTE